MGDHTTHRRLRNPRRVRELIRIAGEACNLLEALQRKCFTWRNFDRIAPDVIAKLKTALDKNYERQE